VKYIEITLLILGVAMLVLGYRKNNRNILAASALVLLVSAGIADFVQGFEQGVTGSSAVHAESSAG
jgi:hypothetical protein